MRKRLLIYLSSIAAVSLIAFGVYWRLSPKIITKPAIDEHYNAVVFMEDQAFPYRPQVRFHLPVTWHIEGTLLNNAATDAIGVSINPETGEITWQDKREGPFSITITASNRMGKDRQSFTARQIIKPLFEITFPPEIPADREFRGGVRTSGSLPIQYACTTAGITFDSRGVIWQKPEPGTYTVTLIASNQAGTCERDWNVVVKAAPVKIESEPVAVATEGDDYIYPVMASGTPKFTWELTECPKGMIVGKEGVVFLPSRYVKKGECKVTIRVSNMVNGQKYSDTQSYTLRCVVREKKDEEQEPPQEEKKKEEKKEKKKQEYAKAQVVPDVNVIVNKRKKDEVKEPTPEKEVPQKLEEKPVLPPPQPQVSQEEERKEQERLREEEQKQLLEAQKKLEEERLRQEELQKRKEEMQRLEAQKRAEEEKQRLEAQRKAEEEKKQQEEAQRRLEVEQKRQEEQRKAEEAKRLEEEQRKAAEEKRKEQMRKALEEKRLQEERKKAEEEKQRLEEQKNAEEVKKRLEEQRRLEQQKKAEEEETRLREEQKKAGDEKRRREEQRKAQAEKQTEEKQVAVPTKKEIVREKTEKGKKVKLTYDFVLEGWSFDDFYELSRASGFKILFISPFKGVEEKNYEVTGIDRQGRLTVQMLPLDENNYSKKGCMVVDIPAEGRAHWMDYETRLREQLKKGSHSLVVFFPYSFMASLEDASRSYYAVHCADRNTPFEQGAGAVRFKITGDRFIKIVSMGD